MIEQQTQNRIKDSITFLKLRGSLDERTSLTFKKSVFSIPNSKRVLVLDATRLDQVSHTGLGTLIDSFRYFNNRGGSIFLVSPNEELRLLIQHFKATELCTIVESYDEVQDQLQLNPGAYQADDKAPVVHHHYYGRKLADHEDLVSNSEPTHTHHDATADSRSLSQLATTLSKLQATLSLQNADIAQETLRKVSELERRDLNLDQKLTQIDRIESKLTDKITALQKDMNAAIDDRFDRLEARLIDRNFYSSRSVSPQPQPAAVSAESESHQSENQPLAQRLPSIRLIECNHCKTVLRLKQSGRHQCPVCATPFTVDRMGRSQF